MKSIKVNASEFWEKHKVAIIGTAAGIAGVGVALWGGSMYNKGFMDGGYAGFWLTVEWLEKEFPEKEVRKAVEAWKDANPDQWVTR